MGVSERFDTLKESWSAKIGDKTNTHELGACIYSMLEANVHLWINYNDDNTTMNYPIVGIGPGCLICKAGNNLSIKCKYPKNTNDVLASQNGDYIPILDHVATIVRPKNNIGTFAAVLESYKPREIDDSLDL